MTFNLFVMKTTTFYLAIPAIIMLGVYSCKKDKPNNLTVSDIDGNVYKTVKIGDQVWMAENLRTTKLNDGTPIALVSDKTTWADQNITDPMTCYYDIEASNLDKYGLMYNWYAVNTGKLAPKGWHVANQDDWEEMISYLIANGYNYDETNKVDNHIAKSLAATNDWITDNTAGSPGNEPAKNNKTGFNAQPAGYRNPDGSFMDLGIYCLFWNATLDAQAGIRSTYIIRSDLNNLYEENAFGGYGLYVRCVKD